jgi:hypothetical protein
MNAATGLARCAAAAAATITFVPALAEAAVEVKYDRFRDATGVILKVDVFDRRTRKSTLMLISSFKGEKRSEAPPDHMVFSLISTSDDWRYLSCRIAAMLVDGKPVSFPPLEHDGTVGRGYVMEHLKGETDLAFAKAIASAKTSIEMKVCNDEFNLPMSLAAEAGKFLHELGASASAPSAVELLDIGELERLEQLIKCNIEKTREGMASTAVSASCGGVFRDGRVQEK